ncbi:MAG: DNA polymerase II large subunit, partial [Nanoarchaeota archaeon]
DDAFSVSFATAVLLSKQLGVPLHPHYIFYWNQLSYAQFLDFIDWCNHALVHEGKLLFSYSPLERERFLGGKRALELLGVEHSVGIEHVIIEQAWTGPLLINLGFPASHDGELAFSYSFKKYEELFMEPDEKAEGKKILEIINMLSSFVIKDKAGEFIGSRMGRPEKAKLRKLTGSPAVLFPVGEEGGRLRSVNEAARVGSVKGDFPNYFCPHCLKESIYRRCEVCHQKTTLHYFCNRCSMEIENECDIHHVKQEFKSGKIDMSYYLEKAREQLQLSKNEMPELIKGIRGTSSENHDLEHLAKGILRTKHKLCVNKDGTIRYDMTEIPLTHFKPVEIGVSVSTLISLGYIRDCYGAVLEHDTQILELKPHDVLLPYNIASGDERGDDVFMSISRFIDELLVKFYGLSPFFSLKTRNDLIGQLGVAMAPHNCAGVICRIIGFSKVQGLVASPYLHAAMRRDCDGDEAALMLLMDVLLNFSRKFLPSHRGGTQDAPLVLNGKIFAREVDDQILDFELVYEYPLELYEKAEKGLHSSEVSIEMVKQRLKNGIDPYVNTGFTHDTIDFNAGCTCSSYKTLPTMKDKVAAQMNLCEKLRSVDHADVARLIIDRHFMRDLKGNLRKFSQQNFRCSTCNTIYRRPPLRGTCSECGGKIIFTISYGSIVKYLASAMELIANYDVPAYIQQDLALTKKYIESIFGKDNEKQQTINKWF